MSPRLAFAMNAAHAAGRSTLAHFQNLSAVEVKRDGSPVTIADREAEAIIRKLLAAAYPGEAILGEEEGESGVGDSRWVVDPIDGTKSFVCGVPLYGTLISFEREGRAEVAVSYFPALDLMVAAERGKGALANGVPCRVSRRADMSRATLCCGSHLSMEKHARSEGFMTLAREVQATRTWGDAYGHCLVAMGRVEAMIDPVVNPWDVSSVALIVEEAGGRCTTFAGEDNPQHEAVSTNGLLHERILGAFRP
jgi:histidinol-phosphatase